MCSTPPCDRSGSESCGHTERCVGRFVAIRSGSPTSLSAADLNITCSCLGSRSPLSSIEVRSPCSACARAVKTVSRSILCRSHGDMHSLMPFARAKRSRSCSSRIWSGGSGIAPSRINRDSRSRMSRRHQVWKQCSSFETPIADERWLVRRHRTAPCRSASASNAFAAGTPQ